MILQFLCCLQQDFYFFFSYLSLQNIQQINIQVLQYLHIQKLIFKNQSELQTIYLYSMCVFMWKQRVTNLENQKSIFNTWDILSH